MKLSALNVGCPQGDSGRLYFHDENYLFRYQDGGAANTAISLLMPVRVGEYRHRELHPVFQMNLPEGYVLEQLRNRLAKTVDVDPMLLLALSGGNAPIGRVFVHSEQLENWLNPQPFTGETLESVLRWDGTEDLFAELVDRYILRAGISGVQPKVLVPERPDVDEQKFTSKTSDLIIKSGRDEFPGLAINEFLCMSIAKEAGMPVPEFYLSDNAKLFVMRRFDRDDALNPLGFEDMAVLMGLSAEKKYSKSYSAIAKAVRLYCPPEQINISLRQLFDSVALSCIVGNGDAHLKNFGLLYSEPGQHDARLAPAYDIVNTTAYIEQDVLALDLVGNKSLFASRQGLLDFAVTCEVANPVERIRHLLAAYKTVIGRFPELCQQVPHVVSALNRSAEPFMRSFA
ncbi:type II toxin-antitoxin system HipA family toxin [Pseudomonas turukhanskensis]|uniref:HipA family protein n=1 Tax=Pseudomonas turukhanskensis TaxID=1806536 RepID=A0A9W6NHL5_9PSED|nr:type II toxin-antitoxin system HipA family toxin [Pseudomonas turukhanskensis]GLK91017.1 hipA family protein [Pseudomonas turukhanskensis]